MCTDKEEKKAIMTKKQKKLYDNLSQWNMYLYETTRIGCHRHNMIQFLIAFYFYASNLWIGVHVHAMQHIRQ